MLLRVPFKLFTLEGIRRYLGQVLACWQEAAQQPILIKRSFILPDELLNLLELEIDELANWRSSLFRASFPAKRIYWRCLTSKTYLTHTPSRLRSFHPGGNSACSIQVRMRSSDAGSSVGIY